MTEDPFKNLPQKQEQLDIRVEIEKIREVLNAR
jgi:hypothetical protein